MNGFTVEEGKLVVQSGGPYYIYGQAFFEISSGATNRAALTVNGDPISLLQATTNPDSATYGTRFTSTIKFLEKGDRIGFMSPTASKMWMAPLHTFFGAFQIAREK